MSDTKTPTAGAAAGVPATFDGNQLANELHRYGPTAVRLVIDPAAPLEALTDDCNCLLSSALDVIEAMTEDCGNTPGWWAMLYTLRQAHAVYGRVYSLAQAVDDNAAAAAAAKLAKEVHP